jgi:hypothetical protein
MKRIIALGIVLTLVVILNATRAGCLFLTLNPSAISRAMGNNGSVADAWHESPNIGWSNPGLASIHDGLHIGYLRDSWFKETGIDDLYYNFAYANMTYRGFGITIPLPHEYIDDRLLFGNSFTYGERHRTDEQNNDLGTFESYETAAKFTVSMNPFEFYLDRSEMLNYFDLGIGVTYTHIHSSLGPERIGNIEGDTDADATGYTFDAGIIATQKWHKFFNIECIELESSFGYNYVNICENEIDYGDGSYPLPESTYMGCGIYTAIPTKNFDFLSVYQDYVPHILSIMAIYGEQDDKVNSYDSDGYGCEIGLFDVFYYRCGYYNEKVGGRSGHSDGFGVRLSYKGLVTFEGNWAYYAGGSYSPHQEMNDWMLGFDIIKIAEMFNSSRLTYEE